MDHNTNEIGITVIKVLAEMLHIEKDAIKMESSLVDDLSMDSFTAIEMLFELEDKYGLEIPDAQIQQFHRVADIVSYIEGRMRQGYLPKLS